MYQHSIMSSPKLTIGFYVGHLYANFRDAGHLRVTFKGKLWRVATTCMESDFNKRMTSSRH